MGRRKISLEKIDNPHARQICFSKRRKGLFRKATELCNQGGGEVAIVIFSSAGNLYCYGWPGVDSVVGRYFKHRFALAAAAADGGRANGGTGLCGEGVGRARWWDVPVEGMELYELEVLHGLVGELRKKAAERTAWLLGDKSGEAATEEWPCLPSDNSKQVAKAPSSESELSLDLRLKLPC